jgi:hypothetical protein
MRRRQIDITVNSTADAATIYDLLLDAASWPRWTSMESVEIERPGDAQGLDEIRVNHRGRVTGRDQVVELIANRRYAYVALSGLPIKEYRGQVDLEPTANGTTIHWSSSFFPKYPGMGLMLQRGIGKFLQECAEGLARCAELQETGAPAGCQASTA